MCALEENVILNTKKELLLTTKRRPIHPHNTEGLTLSQDVKTDQGCQYLLLPFHVEYVHHQLILWNNMQMRVRAFSVIISMELIFIMQLFQLN